jgi:glycine/D-amino acid oxidase-like deaminating enzyme
MVGGSKVDTIVIGGGVIGASSAYWLVRSGRSVMVLERRQAVGTLTTANALGTLRTQFGTPALVRLAQESLDFYRNADRHLGISPRDLGWANQGYLYLTDEPDHIERLQQSLAHYRSLGVTGSEVVTRPELEKRFPFAGRAVAGIFHRDGSWVDPAVITGAWMAAAAREGAGVATGTAAGAVRSEGGRWLVDTEGATLVADEVVVCAGPYTPAMLAPFGVDVPLRITARYRAFIPDPPTGPDPAHQAAPLVINIANGSYWRPVPGGVWLSTANVDDRSVEPRESVDPPPDFVNSCADEIEPVSPALASLARRAASAGMVTVGGGFLVYPADDVPYIGHVPGHPNLYANYGHWAGVMLSPASGRLLVDVMNGTVDQRDNPCRLNRFDGHDIGQALGQKSTNKFGGWG